MRTRSGMMLLAGMSLVVVGCGDDEPDAAATTTVVTSSSTTVTVATSTSAPSSTTPTTSPSSTSTAPTTAPVTFESTAPPTTAPPTTAAPPTGWEPVTFVESVSPVGYSGNYVGQPSPAMPSEPSATLADGYYTATLLEPWRADDPGVLRVELASFRPCVDIGDACFENDDPTELGIDPTDARPVDIALDDTTNVIVRGFRCFGTDEVKVATGTQLTELLSAYTADYAAVMQPVYDAGADFDDVLVAVDASSDDGFIAVTSVCDEESSSGAGLALYEHADAPLLLLQTISWFGDDGERTPLGASDLVRLNGVDVRGGVMTFYFYAGFSS